MRNSKIILALLGSGLVSAAAVSNRFAFTQSSFALNGNPFALLMAGPGALPPPPGARPGGPPPPRPGGGGPGSGPGAQPGITPAPTARPTATPTSRPNPTPTSRPTPTPTSRPNPTPTPTPTSGGGYGNRVSITTDSTYRYVSGNGIPDHATGAFPNAHNPNSIKEQNYNFRMLLIGKAGSKATDVGMYPWGVAVNSVTFDPLANEFWNNDRNSGWQYEPLGNGINLGLDDNNAHVQPSGAYHYHGIPTALLERLGGNSHMALLGYAADGFPVYGPYCYTSPSDANSGLTAMASSYQLKSGTRTSTYGSGPGGTYDGTFIQDYEYVAGSGDLDECNGRYGVTPEYPNGTYYYVLSDNWPVIPRKFKGSPDSSFFR